MDVVKLGLAAWKEMGRLYAEWREPWESSTQAYAEGRAQVCSLLLCAVRFGDALKAACPRSTSTNRGTCG
eukprot:1067565-Prymnesium_polylepis.1